MRVPTTPALRAGHGEPLDQLPCEQLHIRSLGGPQASPYPPSPTHPPIVGRRTVAVLSGGMHGPPLGLRPTRAA